MTEWVKRVERAVGYENHEDVLRWEFGSNTELNEFDTAGSRADSGRHSEDRLQRKHGANREPLVGAAQFLRIWGHRIAGCRNRSKG